MFLRRLIYNMFWFHTAKINKKLYRKSCSSKTFNFSQYMNSNSGPLLFGILGISLLNFLSRICFFPTWKTKAQKIKSFSMLWFFPKYFKNIFFINNQYAYLYQEWIKSFGVGGGWWSWLIQGFLAIALRGKG